MILNHSWSISIISRRRVQHHTLISEPMEKISWCLHKQERAPIKPPQNQTKEIEIYRISMAGDALGSNKTNQNQTKQTEIYTVPVAVDALGSSPHHHPPCSESPADDFTLLPAWLCSSDIYFWTPVSVHPYCHTLQNLPHGFSQKLFK